MPSVQWWLSGRQPVYVLISFCCIERWYNSTNFYFHWSLLLSSSCSSINSSSCLAFYDNFMEFGLFSLIKWHPMNLFLVGEWTLEKYIYAFYSTKIKIPMNLPKDKIFLISSLHFIGQWTFIQGKTNSFPCNLQKHSLRWYY